MPEITVVIPARNASMTIRRTLEALAKQRVSTDYEVVIVDSGSTDATPSIVSESGVACLLLHNPRGEPASSRNMGVKHGSGRVLAFTDADCEPEPSWLASGLRALDRADLVQGKVVPASEPGPFDRTLHVNSEYGLYETANLFVRREVFERVGGFEPMVVLDAHPFGEDVWFAWRAKRGGARSAFADDAIVYHAVFRRTAAGFVAERWRLRFFPALARRVPELRQDLFYRRIFLNRRSAVFDLAAAGAALAAKSRNPLGLTAVIPYLGLLRNDVREATAQPGLTPAKLAGARLAADAVGAAAMAYGTARSRSLLI